jgi:heme-degrading monooxygenase HmoA
MGLGVSALTWVDRRLRISDRPETRVIARIWRGVVATDDTAAYAAYVHESGLKEYAQTPGNRGAWLLTRDRGGRTEFLALSLWDSMEAITAFAGEDVDKARYYPEDDRLLEEKEETVAHTTVAATEGT